MAFFTSVVERFPGHFAGTLLVRRSTFDAIGPIAEIGGGGDFFDWYARLIDSPFRVTTVPEVVLRRRLHLSNLGRQNDPAQRYARVLRRVVDRRRGRSPIRVSCDCPARVPVESPTRGYICSRHLDAEHHYSAASRWSLAASG
jgi:hypothetical protein